MCRQSHFEGISLSQAFFFFFEMLGFERVISSLVRQEKERRHQPELGKGSSVDLVLCCSLKLFLSEV
jgi:hypothetical protein